MAETRSERIAVKITPKIYEELARLAEEIGQTPSTLASVYLGEAINKKRIERENNQRLSETIGVSFKEMFEPMLNGVNQALVDQQPKEE